MRCDGEPVRPGKAPDYIVATKFQDNDRTKPVERTRPLCVYPARAQWGDIEMAGKVYTFCHDYRVIGKPKSSDQEIGPRFFLFHPLMTRRRQWANVRSFDPKRPSELSIYRLPSAPELGARRYL